MSGGGKALGGFLGKRKETGNFDQGIYFSRMCIK